MFLILTPDEPHIPPAPPAAIATYARPAPVIDPRPTVLAAWKPAAELQEIALQMAEDVLTGADPLHVARQVEGQATCPTCETSWPCPPIVKVLKTAAAAYFAAGGVLPQDFVRAQDGAL